jgi:LysM repeat protein
MNPRRRQELARYAAPAAFLAAATIAVLLVKAGLEGGEPLGTTVEAPAKRAPTTTARTAPKLVLTTTTPTTTTAGRYYAVQSGDTLGSIAVKYDTTVEALLALNPEVDPSALHVGQQIRVG